jgi:hypothetical protein
MIGNVLGDTTYHVGKARSFSYNTVVTKLQPIQITLERFYDRCLSPDDIVKHIRYAVGSIIFRISDMTRLSDDPFVRLADKATAEFATATNCTQCTPSRCIR